MKQKIKLANFESNIMSIIVKSNFEEGSYEFWKGVKN